MENHNKQTWIKLIHTARHQLNLDDEAYRLILQSAAGVTSSKDLQTSAQFDEIMKIFKKLGFHYHQKQEVILPNRVSKAQIAYIKKLWNIGSRSKTETSLRHFLQRIVHVDDVRFLTKQQASAVILALQDMLNKAQNTEPKQDEAL